MKQHKVLLFIILGLIIGSTGCTSKKVDQESSDISELTGESDGAAEASSDEASDDFASEDTAEAGAAEDGASAAPADETASNEGLEELGEGEDVAATDEFSEDGADETAATEPAPADETATDVASAGTAEELSTSEVAPPEEPSSATNTAVSEASSSDEMQGLSEESAPAKPVIPLQKMMTTPYRKNGVLVNGLYVARTGDTTESVSQKIYGADKTAELKDINSTLARRSMKVGDKVYYSSPNRPTDESTILTYYEDKGLAPEVYLSKSGDNIRTVAKELLGETDSWKELWSTNLEVESKGELDEGTRLRYWSTESASVSAPAVAANTAPPIEDQMAPPPMAEPPPLPDEAAVSPPSDVAAMETAPPPPMEEVAPPPPPMAEAPPVSAQVDSASNLTEDPDQMMTLMTGAVLLIAAIAMFIIIRKKRAKRSGGIEFQTAANTHID